jgi:hypothetical protein
MKASERNPMKNPESCAIDQAVHALEEAIEKKKMQMQHPSAPSGGSPVVAHLFSAILNRAGGSYGPLNQVLAQGGEFARDFIKKAQENIQQRPWEVLQKVAVSSFGIGLFLSLRRKKSSRGEKA